MGENLHNIGFGNKNKIKTEMEANQKRLLAIVKKLRVAGGATDEGLG